MTNFVLPIINFFIYMYYFIFYFLIFTIFYIGPTAVTANGIAFTEIIAKNRQQPTRVYDYSLWCSIFGIVYFIVAAIFMIVFHRKMNNYGVSEFLIPWFFIGIILMIAGTISSLTVQRIEEVRKELEVGEFTIENMEQTGFWMSITGILISFLASLYSFYCYLYI
jgi:hypothetical protein